MAELKRKRGVEYPEDRVFNQRRRIDTFFNEVDKLKKSNVRRFRRCKEMGKKIFSMENLIEEMKARISFLESVNADFEKENLYFRDMYFGDEGDSAMEGEGAF